MGPVAAASALGAGSRGPELSKRIRDQLSIPEGPVAPPEVRLEQLMAIVVEKQAEIRQRQLRQDNNTVKNNSSWRTLVTDRLYLRVRILAVSKILYGHKHVKVAESMCWLADAYVEGGMPQQAMKHADYSLCMLRELGVVDHGDALTNHHSRAPLKPISTDVTWLHEQFTSLALEMDIERRVYVDDLIDKLSESGSTGDSAFRRKLTDRRCLQDIIGNRSDLSTTDPDAAAVGVSWQELLKRVHELDEFHDHMLHLEGHLSVERRVALLRIFRLASGDSQVTAESVADPEQFLDHLRDSIQVLRFLKLDEVIAVLEGKSDSPVMGPMSWVQLLEALVPLQVCKPVESVYIRLLQVQGETLTMSGRTTAAKRALTRAAHAQEKLVGRDHASAISLYYCLAALYVRDGGIKMADQLREVVSQEEEWFKTRDAGREITRKALELMKQWQLKDDSTIAKRGNWSSWEWEKLARKEIMKDKMAQVKKEYKADETETMKAALEFGSTLTEVTQKTFGAGHPETARAWYRLAMMFSKAHMLDDAVDNLKNCIKTYNAAGLDWSGCRAVAVAETELGDIYQDRKEHSMAANRYQRAADMFQGLSEFDSAISLLRKQAKAHASASEFEEALEVRKKILQLVRDKGSGDSLTIATAFKQKGLVLKQMRRYSEASQSLMCAKNLLEIYMGPKHEKTRKVQAIIQSCVKQDPRSVIGPVDSKLDDD